MQNPIASLFLSVLIVLLSPSCTSKKSEAPEPSKSESSAQTRTTNKATSSSEPDLEPSRTRAALTTRKLLESGSVAKVHPAANMERPDKWKSRSEPSAVDVLADRPSSLIPQGQASRLEDIGLDKTNVYTTNSSPTQVVEEFKKNSPRAIVHEEQGVSVVSIPVKEGTVLVATSRTNDGKTVVNEVLLKDSDTPIQAPLWLKEKESEHRQSQ